MVHGSFQVPGQSDEHAPDVIESVAHFKIGTLLKVSEALRDE
jgi:hypothetical protein